MMTVFTKLTLPEMLVETETIAEDAQRAFGRLNVQQLNWKPESYSTSIGFHLWHLGMMERRIHSPIREACGADWFWFGDREEEMNVIARKASA